jgi:integrase
MAWSLPPGQIVGSGFVSARIDPNSNPHRTMQRGSLAMVSRKEAPAVWQFRWSERDLHGIRIQRKRVIGTVARYRDEGAAHSSVAVLLQEINSHKLRMGSRSITVAQLCHHFEQRELAKENVWRSYATKKTYHAYLTRWVLPQWRYELAEVRTAIGEEQLRQNPKSNVRAVQPCLPLRAF